MCKCHEWEDKMSIKSNNAVDGATETIQVSVFLLTAVDEIFKHVYAAFVRNQ